MEYLNFVAWGLVVLAGAIWMVAYFKQPKGSRRPVRRVEEEQPLARYAFYVAGAGFLLVVISAVVAAFR